MFFGKNKSEKKYKFNSLNIYAWDRTVGGKKKFRKLFERAELNYVSVELSIYNKLFDESDWEAEIMLIVNKIESDEKSSRLNKKIDTVNISKNDNIYQYSFGWGSDERGDFWEQGIYEWEAYIDGEFISSTKFYVEDEGKFKTDDYKYLSVLSLHTYEAPEGDLDAADRVYLKSFDIGTTRYIMGELRFTNLVAHEWHCELFFNIYDDTGMLVGSSDSFVMITPEDGVGEVFTVTSGWGRSDAGSWVEDNYTLEIIFMDEVIAVIPFSVGDKEVERISDYEALINEDVGSIFKDTLEIKESNVEKQKDDTKESPAEDDSSKKDKDSDDEIEVFIDDRPIEEILAELNGLIGLENIKDKIKEYIDYISFLQFREESGIKEDEDVILHSVFTGNPGTGKTTVVKLLGKIYQSMGLLSKGHVHSVEASDLISGFIRQTGKDTKKAIEKARGGILFIDEAYMLFKEGSGSDFGPEAVAALITEMSDGKGDIAIMVAGYPKEMEAFIDSNPGLKSRFRNNFHFEDYTPDELFKIAEFAAVKKSVNISKSAEKQLKKVLTEAFRKRDRTFG
ncbi:MAG: AAA family ATPase, partial [Bacteroidota bacterium]